MLSNNSVKEIGYFQTFRINYISIAATFQSYINANIGQSHFAWDAKAVFVTTVNADGAKSKSEYK